MPARTTTWNIDAAHTELGFRVRHMMVSWTRGRFRSFSGTVSMDEAQPERSRIDVIIDAASVDTGLAARDEHLRSADFLDVERHPTLTFRSSSVRSIGGGAFEVVGDLTIHGVTRPVALEVEGVGSAVADPWGGIRRGARARASVDRKDFDLFWNGALESGGVLVGDEVRIEIEAELIRAVPAPAVAA